MNLQICFSDTIDDLLGDCALWLEANTTVQVVIGKLYGIQMTDHGPSAAMVALK